VSFSSRGGWSAMTVSVLLHGVVALLAVAAYLYVRKPPPREVRLAIEATVIRPVSQAPRRVAPVPAPAPVAEPPPAEDPAEEKAEEERKAEVARQAAAEKAADEKAERQKAEEEKVAKEKATRERAEKEKADKEKAEKEKVEQEKLAQEKAARDKAAKEKAALDKQARDKTLAEQQRAQREADLNAQIAAEERASAARNSSQMAQYIARITAKIEGAWIRPASAQPGLNCEVRVTQVAGGTVVAAQVVRCNGDEIVRQSIETAVLRASPLPLPSDPALFERDLVVTFRPEN
jgi:colicin import membrane protein